jgi:pyruvate,water dikinase
MTDIHSDAILLFSAINKSDLPLVGGKGANLGEMTQAGFPVPPGFCVTTAVFNQFIAACPQMEEMYAALETITPQDVAAARQIGQQIRELLHAAPVPEESSQTILAAWRDLGDEHTYAIRSSATAEDLPDASFAGQQDTYLNVKGADTLLTAVRNCWVSLFTDRAILYRSQNKFNHREVSLSVVVQRMVLPEVSGIMFTADPVSGARHVASIDASYGLGEALVAGLVSADLYKVDRRVWQVTEVKTGAKEIAIRPSPDGGVHRENIPPTARSARVLNDGQVIILSEIGERIARHYGRPQDIEWALAGGKFYILQSRPITALYPLPAGMPPEPLRVMFSFGAVQGMLDPMTPLGRDTIKGIFAAAARDVFAYRNVQLNNQQVLFEAGERLWSNSTPILRHPIGRKLGNKVMPLIEPAAAQALISLQDDPRLLPQRGWFRFSTFYHLAYGFLPMIGRLLAALRRPEQTRVQIQQMSDGIVADLAARAETAVTLSEQITLYHEMLDVTFPVVIPTFVPTVAGGMAPFNLLAKLAESVGQDALVFTRGLPHNVTTEMDLALWRAAQQIKEDETAAGYFTATEAARLAADYQAGQMPSAAQTAVARFLKRYGMRGLAEIDIGRPRWRENPVPVMQSLQSYLRIDDPARAPDAMFARGAAEAEAALESLVTALRQTPSGRFKARLAQAAAIRLRALAGLRESPKFLIIRLFGIVRDSLLECGQTLAEAGVLENADDLFFLHAGELEQLAQGAEGDWRGVINGRRQQYAQEKRRRQIPRLLLNDGRAYYEGVSAPAAGEAEDGTLTGSPVSPGVVEGRVQVVLDPYSTQLAPGDILVCPGTDPSWTPLFLAAGGLVMEMGGLMTHGSVVAREYGIPAVVGVNQATTRLETGQRIRVDGSAGTVTILSG